MNYHITLKSENIKTGAIPVTTSSRDTCPDACVFKNNGCYASSGALNFHWRKVDRNERGGDINYLAGAISNLTRNTFYRINQAGDLPGINNKINKRLFFKLVKANKGKKGYSYSHKPVIGDKNYIKNNREYIKYSNKNGLTINLSGNSLSHADKLKELNIGPVATVVPFGTKNTFFTPAGHKGIVCPAQRENSKITCEKCQLCQKQREVIVGFLGHGAAKNKVNKIANE